MKIFSDIKSIRTDLEKFKDKKIGFIPTMGALHQGHLSLIHLAKKHCDIVVVSIFVNQKQFNNPQDYELYPSTLENDIKLLQDTKVDMLFNPQAAEIYNQNFSTKIIISGLTENLCGKSRVGHFEAVALIVSKLFNIIKPNFAFFGEKDFQQLQVIRRLVADLNIDTQIISGATTREIDGLAMSSRNLRLSAAGRKIAGQIYQHLYLAKEQIIANENLDFVLSKTAQNLLAIGAEKIDYLQVCDEENLQPISSFNSQIKSRLFIAIYVDKIRLIDNISLDQI
ncbi:MAG: pantoate--beta-alanine ligase [Pseudomonadota bacterium]